MRTSSFRLPCVKYKAITFRKKHIFQQNFFFQVPDPDAVAGPLEVQLCDRMVDRLGAELEKEN